jgi:hypothetical protein
MGERLLSAERAEIPLRWQASYRLGEVSVVVVAVGASMLVDLNRADAELLSRTLEMAGAAPAAAARVLADAIVQWRPPGRGPGGALGRYAALEDLLQVEGVNRVMLDAARDYLAVLPDVSAQAAWNARAPILLRQLAALRPASRARHAQLQSEGLDLLQPGAGRVLRVDALMRLGARVWLRRCWVDSGQGSAALPWTTLRREPAAIVPVDVEAD